MNLKGKVALITGGGTGIGSAIARRFVADGAKVCITGRRQEMLDQTARSMPAGSVTTYSGDVGKYDDARRMVEKTVAFGGKLDVLVNNAGISPNGTVVDMEVAEWQQTLDINLTGPFLLMKAAIPHIIKAGGGSVINIASLAGLRCLNAKAAYSATKAGLIMLTQQAALDFGPAKVRCNVVCPGATLTPMTEGLDKLLKTDKETAQAILTANSPLRRAATPDEMTGICSYLASDDSSFMTGAVLVMDGGAAIVDVNGAAIGNALRNMARG